uniref:Putative FAD linked oxidase C-terminal domain-containing protein n=1 Tax=Stutzerimonas stutzeri TaxID=316 RepID=A0A0S2UNY0_STUST|nr:putative FAD linked oxidase C-terminal domain-containing protein [Stutzerimonas stutzeri]
MNIAASEPASAPWNPERILAALRADASIGEVLAGADIGARYLNDWSGEEGGRPLALVRPHNTAEIARVLALCHSGRCPVVPQGGLTGLAGGATPIEGCVLVSLERMSGVVELDPASATMTVLAGTPLQVVQEAAQAAGFLFALDLGARGSCQIGGNIATNAGGNRVIRYGMARDLVLGLEAVLPDGTVLSMMNKMVKNNAGPDLKHLFIGTEGTLGIITQAVLRLHPGVSGANTALVAAPDFGSAIKLLRHAQHLLGGRVSAFEMMWQDYYAAATTAGGIAAPLPATYPLYVLLDLQAAAPEEDAARFEAMLEHALAEGWIADAAVAQSHTQTQAFWELRDAISEMLRTFAPTINFDVSAPISGIEECVARMREALARDFPGVRAIYFGHVGDGNVHIVVGSLPTDDRKTEQRIEAAFYAIVRSLSGSVSAEHGIGLHKRPWLHYSRNPAELSLIATVKRALDPHGIMNPGKILAS